MKLRNLRVRKFFAISGAMSGIILGSFGPASELVLKKNPWHGFQAEDALLVVARVQKFPSTHCEKWIQAVNEDLSYSPSFKNSDLEKNWKPWKEKDLSAVESCEDFPCDVKLKEAEVSQLKSLPAPDRKKKYLEMVEVRIKNYLGNQSRPGYEFPGIPVDPWTSMSRFLGESSQIKRGVTPVTLSARVLNFSSGSDPQMRPIRQVLDRRSWIAPDSKSVAVWIRDVYTDHYFDSWGEWISLSCLSSNEVLLIQSLMVEFDLLKKTDLLSKIMRGKMKSAVEEQGSIYLNGNYLRLKEAVGE